MVRPASLANRIPARLHFLDGLRGWAALGVLVFHASWEFFGALIPVVDFPVLAVLGGGRLSVSVFFVLTGVVLTYPVIQSGDIDRVRAAFLGRYVRLTIPIFAAGLINLVLVSRGLVFNKAAALILANGWLSRLAEPGATPGELVYFVLLGVFTHPQSSMTFGPFLWTMHYELWGSAIIFTILLVGQTSVRTRWVLYAAGLVAALMLWAPIAPFLYGMLIAELMATRRYALTLDEGHTRLASLAILLVTAALCYRFRAGFYPGMSGALAGVMVLATVLSADMQRFLQIGVSQWLGRISFPLYLVHGSVLVSLSSYLVVWFGPAGLGLGAIVLIVLAGLAVSLACAQLLAPIEIVAIRSAHFAARLVLVRSERQRDQRSAV